jgi:hypothetical protein
MRTIQWSDYTWITEERWGNLHPEKTYAWYDSHAVSIGTDNSLHLKTHYSPRWFPNLKVWSNTGVGLVSCTTKFKWGEFVILAKLPIGLNLWPAFWAWSWDTWPPEIDVFEGYTNKYSNYSLWGFLPLRRIESNIHYIKDNIKLTLAMSNWLVFKDPTQCFISYKMVWLPDSIKIYYNNRLIRTINDPLIMNSLNKTTLNVVINNHVTKDHDKTYSTDNLESLEQTSDFVIKHFKYTPM